MELQKPAASQPTVNEVLDLVLKECKKESLVYKMAALHSAADILESTQEDRFQEITNIVVPLIKKVHLHAHSKSVFFKLWHFILIELQCNNIAKNVLMIYSVLNLKTFFFFHLESASECQLPET